MCYVPKPVFSIENRVIILIQKIEGGQSFDQHYVRSLDSALIRKIKV